MLHLGCACFLNSIFMSRVFESTREYIKSRASLIFVENCCCKYKLRIYTDEKCQNEYRIHRTYLNQHGAYLRIQWKLEKSEYSLTCRYLKTAVFSFESLFLHVKRRCNEMHVFSTVRWKLYTWREWKVFQNDLTKMGEKKNSFCRWRFPKLSFRVAFAGRWKNVQSISLCSFSSFAA